MYNSVLLPDNVAIVLQRKVLQGCICTPLIPCACVQLLAGCAWRPAMLGLDMGTLEVGVSASGLQRAASMSGAAKRPQQGKGAQHQPALQDELQRIAALCKAAQRLPESAVLAVHAVRLNLYQGDGCSQQARAHTNNQKHSADAELLRLSISAPLASANVPDEAAAADPRSDAPAIFWQLECCTEDQGKPSGAAPDTGRAPASSAQPAHPHLRSSGSLRRNVSRLPALVSRRSAQQRQADAPSAHQIGTQGAGSPSDGLSALNMKAEQAPISHASMQPAQPASAPPQHAANEGQLRRSVQCDVRISGLQMSMSTACSFKLPALQFTGNLLQPTSAQVGGRADNTVQEKQAPHASLAMALQAPHLALNVINAKHLCEAIMPELQPNLAVPGQAEAGINNEAVSGCIRAAAMEDASASPTATAACSWASPATVPTLGLAPNNKAGAPSSASHKVPLTWRFQVEAEQAACLLQAHDTHATGCTCSQWQLSQRCPYLAAGDEVAVHLDSCCCSASLGASDAAAQHGHNEHAITEAAGASETAPSIGKSAVRQSVQGVLAANEAGGLGTEQAVQAAAHAAPRAAAFEPEQSVHSSVVLCSSPEVQ